jgi:hypothetical protein
VQACGDAHLANFGLFASSERRLVFDINDFDETLPGPWEWDVKRLATSLEIAGRDNEFSAKQWREIVVAAVAAYRRAMRSFAVTTALQVWYAIPDAAAVKAWFDTGSRQDPSQEADPGPGQGAHQGQPRRAQPVRGDRGRPAEDRCGPAVGRSAR